MFNWLWKLIGKLAMSDRGIDWLERRAAANPYKSIRHQGSLYMKRGWIIKRRWNLPCVRLHWIMRPDIGRDMHSHPFNFRTIILRGWYIQEYPRNQYWPSQKNAISVAKMVPGMQAICRYGEFHRITQVSKGGCLTLFIMWGGKRHDWGFMTKDGYVQAKDYGAYGDTGVY